MCKLLKLYLLTAGGIDLLTVALPQECLEIILSYIDMLSRINLLETSKFFAAWFATQDWKRSVTEFLKDSNGVNYNQTPPNINWRVIVSYLKNYFVLF